jgi:hypothetical protein
MPSVFLFTSSVADVPLLTDDDPLRDWIERSFGLYRGLGRHPGMLPLFDRRLREGDPNPA